MGILKNNIESFLSGYREGRNGENYQKKEEYVENIQEEVELLIISVDNKQAVEEFIMNRTGWEIEEVRSILNNLPGYVRGNGDEMSYWERTLLDLGSDAYIVSSDERLTLKVISYDGNKGEAINVTKNALGCEADEADELVNNLPFYIDGAIEFVEYWQDRFREIGAKTTIMSYDEAHEEAGDNDEKNYELVLFDSGNSSVECIKIVREYTGMDLVEAKAFVNNLPDSLYGSLEVLKEIQKELSGINVDSCISDAESNVIELDNEATVEKICPRYCTNCGGKIVGNAKFCGKCGAKV